MRKSKRPGFNQAIDDRTQTQGRERRPPQIQVTSPVIAALRYMPVDEKQHNDSQRNIEEKNGAPGNMFNQQSANYWPERRRDRGKTRPDADCLPPFVLPERGADDGKAAGHEQRGTDALRAPGDDELLNAGRQTAPNGGQREQCNADSVDKLPAEAVAERTSGQQ